MAITKLTRNTDRIIEVSSFVRASPRASPPWWWEGEVMDKPVLVHMEDSTMKPKIKFSLGLMALIIQALNSTLGSTIKRKKSSVTATNTARSTLLRCTNKWMTHHRHLGCIQVHLIMTKLWAAVMQLRAVGLTGWTHLSVALAVLTLLRQAITSTTVRPPGQLVEFIIKDALLIHSQETNISTTITATFQAIRVE